MQTALGDATYVDLDCRFSDILCITKAVFEAQIPLPVREESAAEVVVKLQNHEMRD